MDYSIHENGWTVICHTPIQELTDVDKKHLAALFVKNLLVIWKKQKLTPDEQLNFCRWFGDVQNDWPEKVFRDMDPGSKSLFLNGNHPVIRVTNKLDEHGRPGLFPNKNELEWHCHHSHDRNRKLLVWLYGAEHTKGSTTEWNNTYMAYDDLPEDKKELYSKLRIEYFVPNPNAKSTNYNLWQKWYSVTEDEHKEILKSGIRNNDWFNLVTTNFFGRKGLYISPIQAGWVSGMNDTEARNFLKEVGAYVTQPKYVYSHNWEDGDVAISNQVNSIHRRLECPTMDVRVLHRLVFNPNKVHKDLLKMEEPLHVS